MMKLVVVVFLLLFPIASHAQTVEWLLNSSTQTTYDIAVDRDGRVVTGAFYALTTTVDGNTFSSNGSYDIILTKRNPNGSLKWAKSYGGTGTEYVFNVGIDSSNNIIMIGYYTGSSTIGHVTLPTIDVGHYNVFVAKLDSNGTVLWAVKPTTSFMGLQVLSNNMLAVHGDGSCTFTGLYFNSITVGSETLTGTSNSSYYMARLDPNGNVTWSANFLSALYPVSFFGAKDGKVYVAGTLHAPFTIQGHSVSPANANDILIVKFNGDGSLNQTMRINGTAYEHSHAVGVDRDENIYLLGSYNQDLSLGKTVFPNGQGVSQLFYACIEIDGTVKWAKHLASNVYPYPRIVTHPSGTSYFSVQFADSVVFDGIPFKSTGEVDPLIVSYDNTGTRRWHVQGKGPKTNNLFGLGVDGLGAVYFTGLYQDNATFGDKTIAGHATDWYSMIGKIAEPIVLTTSPGGDHYCAGDTVSIRFTSLLSHSFGNQFIAYLSDSLGKFDSLIKIGTLNATDDSTFIGVIPKSTPTGTGYRIRVSSTRPESVGFDRGPSFTIHALPKAKIDPRKPANFCEGESVPLLASGGVRFLWSTGDTTQQITPSVEGWYSVRVWNENDCEASDSIQLKMIPLPVPEITVDGPTMFCEGGQVTLTGKGGKRYAWSNGQTTPSIVVKTAGTYSVNVYNDSNCSKHSEPIEITVHPAPEKPIATFSNDTLSSSSEHGNRWEMIGSAVTDTSRTFRPTKSGTYYVIVRDSNGCESRSDNIEVTVQSGNVLNEVIQSFTITPNPAHHEFEISLPSQQGSITIFDVTGKSMWSSVTSDMASMRITLPISSWPDGVYYVRYELNGSAHTKQIVKQ